jgi:hypothetical protein
MKGESPSSDNWYIFTGMNGGLWRLSVTITSSVSYPFAIDLNERHQGL